MTYDWLSQTLEIHVNTAKEWVTFYVISITAALNCFLNLSSVLAKYVEKMKKSESREFSVVYSVCGREGRNLKFVLATEDDLEGVKAKCGEILFAYVYSIQKGRKFSDYDSLYNVNYSKFKSNARNCNEFSGISCCSVRQRSATDLERKYEQAAESGSSKVKREEISKGSVKTESNTEAKGDVQSPDTKMNVKENSKPVEKKAAAAAGKPTMSAFFAKHQVKTSSVDKKSGLEDASRVSNKRIVREPSREDDEDDAGGKGASETKRFKLSHDDDDDVDGPQCKSSQNVKAKAARMKPANKKKPALGSQKPRKRIQQISDSDSSDAGIYIHIIFRAIHSMNLFHF